LAKKESKWMVLHKCDANKEYSKIFVEKDKVIGLSRVLENTVITYVDRYDRVQQFTVLEPIKDIFRRLQY